METLINYYNNGFISAVTAAGDKGALPLYIIVDDYWSKNNLPGTSKIPIWAETVMQVVTSRSDLLDELINDVSDLRYALKPGAVNRLTTFYVDPNGEAPSKLRDAEGYLQALEGAMAYCKKMLDGGKEVLADGRTVVDACEKGLAGSVPLDKVANLRLPRNYDN